MRKYTVADYAFQFVTVTAGVLIALLIDGLVDWDHNRELVATASPDDCARGGRQPQELEGLPKFIESANADIDNGLKLANDLLCERA